MKTKFITLIIACLQATTLCAQSEGRLYGRVLAYARKGSADSVFYYLDRMATLYGGRNLNLYPELLLEPQLRPYHGDARWSASMTRYRMAKHEVEDSQQRTCQTDTAIKTDNTPVVNHYDIDLTINVAAKRFSVRADIDLDFRGQRYADLYLWRHTQIDQMSLGSQPARYEFAPGIQAPWISDSGRLRIYAGNAQGRARITTAYTGRLDSIPDDSFAACDSSMVMLTYYMGWYPVDINHDQSTADIDIHITPNWPITGSGIIADKEGTWHMSQPWQQSDYTIIASPSLRQQSITRNGRSIEVVSLKFPEADADSVAHNSADIYDLYARLFRHSPDSRQLRIFLFPADGQGAFSRRNFIVCCCGHYDEWLYQLLAHEIGHFWWRSAPTDQWEDWLNESFAEYSSLCAIGHHLGTAVLADYVEAYREWARTACPIKGLARQSEGSQHTFYHKGAILLYDLQQRIGDKAFFDLMHHLAAKRIGSQHDFEAETSRRLSHDDCLWIERRLNQ